VIASLHLLRYVRGSSVVHRAGSKSKVLALTALVFALSLDPTWSSVGVIWAFAAVVFLVARLPLGALPRPPRPLLWAMGLALVFGFFAGGEPALEIQGWSVDVGGLIIQLRLFGVILGLLALALLLGWTTPLAQLPVAAAWMLQPLRRLRIPIDDVVAGLTLAVRVLPLMAEELATATALWATRPGADRRRFADAIDLAATLTTSATRRAIELGEAVANRGPVVVSSSAPPWRMADLVVILSVAGVIAAVASL
jgi:energy-coupling factor transporter transmembrane protein EcfT